MEIIDGRKIRDEILAGLKDRVAALPFVPVFCDVLVGNDPASRQYVDMKDRVAEGLGIEAYGAHFPEEITTEELIDELAKIATLPGMAGLIIQLPMPLHIDARAVLDAVPLALDVDALSTEASNLFYSDEPIFVFPTAAAVLAILDSLDIPLLDMSVCMAGKGMLVGAPVAHMLQARGISVDIIDSSTEDKEEIMRAADIVIAATGVAGLVKGDMLKEGAIVIDAGTSESGGGITGDIERASVDKVASRLSPVPGGVGPVTVAMLMYNVVVSAERLAAKSAQE
jgi:methylenetetrahydrofolate dehydrogenase (NADP+)/methenyltetrahydrofolate cyclohydrolase